MHYFPNQIIAKPQTTLPQRHHDRSDCGHKTRLFSFYHHAHCSGEGQFVETGNTTTQRVVENKTATRTGPGQLIQPHQVPDQL